jgi:dipeptidyl aminopeptidase/acylaminoacyl peptidase
MTRRSSLVALLAVLLALTLVACSRATPGPPSAGSAAPSRSPADTAEDSPSEPAGSPGGNAAGPTTPATAPPHPVSLPAYFDRPVRGGGLRLGSVRERTAAYTSYDASYRSGRLRVTGVLNVPTGRGPFPAVVLAHGYIDPAYYVSGQGMTRERGYLAGRGYVAFHVDYRNHAGSDDDPHAARELRLGYAVDVLAAVRALRLSDRVAVDDKRVALMGRSMGGGVVYKALEMSPGLVSAAAVWAPVSSLEAQNYNRWIRGEPSRSGLDRYVARTYGLPGTPGSRRFWREISARTYLDRITEPLLLVQGGSDDTCPPAWARASYRALQRAGVDAQLAWYPDEEHAFGPRFVAAMDRTIDFFDRRLA